MLRSTEHRSKSVSVTSNTPYTERTSAPAVLSSALGAKRSNSTNSFSVCGATVEGCAQAMVRPMMRGVGFEPVTLSEVITFRVFM